MKPAGRLGRTMDPKRTASLAVQSRTRASWCGSSQRQCKSSMLNEHQWSFWSFENWLHSLLKLHWFQGYERDPLSHPAATDQQIDWSSLAAVGLAAAGAVAFTQGSHDWPLQCRKYPRVEFLVSKSCTLCYWFLKNAFWFHPIEASATLMPAVAPWQIEKRCVGKHVVTDGLGNAEGWNDGPGPPKRFKTLERIWSISSLQAGEPMDDGARQDLLHAVPECHSNCLFWDDLLGTQHPTILVALKYSNSTSLFSSWEVSQQGTCRAFRGVEVDHRPTTSFKTS